MGLSSIPITLEIQKVKVKPLQLVDKAAERPELLFWKPINPLRKDGMNDRILKISKIFL